MDAEGNMSTPPESLAQVRESTKAALADSLGNSGIFYEGINKLKIKQNNDYHINDNKVAAFNIANIIKDNPALASQLDIPAEHQAEFEQLLLELDNVLVTAEDVIERIEAIDVLPDVPVASWIEKLQQASLSRTLLDEHCDY